MQAIETNTVDTDRADEPSTAPSVAEVISLGLFTQMRQESRRRDAENTEPSFPSTEPSFPSKGSSGQDASVLMVSRLSDLLMLSVDKFTLSERALVSEILTRLLDQVDAKSRARLAVRVARMAKPPAEVLQKLARDEFSVAEPILRESAALCDLDLIAIVQNCSLEHRQVIVSRKKLTSALADTLIESDDVVILEQLLRHEGVVFSQQTIVELARKSQIHPSLQSLLISRSELTPRLAYSVFWWMPSNIRLKILKKFSVSRRLVQEAIADAVMGGDINPKTEDPYEKEALQFLLGREHDRRAPIDAILDHLRQGRHVEAVEGFVKDAEISRETVLRIFNDRGGKALAVLC